MRIVFFLLFTLWCFSGFPQNKTRVKTENIGFKYGATAGRSVVFSKIETYLNEKDFKFIPKLLFSKKTAEMFVSTILCLELEKMKKMKFNRRQKKRLLKNQNSESKITLRSGCTCFETVTIRQFINGEFVDFCNITPLMQKWVDTVTQQLH